GVGVEWWVPAINHERFEKIGLRTAEIGFADRIERLRVAIGATPEEWLDLHALHPEALFVDWAGHATPEGCRRTANRIVGALRDRGLPRPGPRPPDAPSLRTGSR